MDASDPAAAATATEAVGPKLAANGPSLATPAAGTAAPGAPAVAAASPTPLSLVPKPSSHLGLDDIRNDLIRQEETIIFGLIERSQFRHNARIYAEGGIPLLSTGQLNGHTFMEYFLLETEKLHAMCSRYQCPDENAFNHGDQLPSAVLAPVEWPQLLIPNAVNANARILSCYVERVVPQICRGGQSTDDSHYGSTALCDINCLQAISKRVHYGKFVAEAKYQSETERYTKLVHARDGEGIMRALTNKAVEERLLRRVRHKALMYGSEIEEEGLCQGAAGKVDPEVIVEIYRDFLIPLTKDVEVEYLLRRCGPVPVACVSGTSGCRRAAAEYWQLDDPASGVGPVTETPTIPRAFEEVRAGHVAWVCVPLETSELGVVKATVEQFLQELPRGRQEPPEMGRLPLSQVRVLGEVFVPAPFVLLGGKGAVIREVAAKPEILRVCQDALQAPHLRGLVCTPVDSTRAALARAQAHSHIAALVPDDGQGLHSPQREGTPGEPQQGFQRESLEGSAVNHFVVVGYGPSPCPSGGDRTVVLFSLRDAAGALVEALQAFDRFGINLSAIHSFSALSKDGSYIFLVQADGHWEDKQVKSALLHLNCCGAVAGLCVLGSFPAAAWPPGLRGASRRRTAAAPDGPLRR